MNVNVAWSHVNRIQTVTTDKDSIYLLTVPCSEGCR